MIDRATLSSKEKETRFFYGYVILFASFFVLLIVGGTLTSFGVFLKPLLNQFGWSRAAISSAYSLSMVMVGVFGILGGRVSDKLNPRLALTLGGVFMGLGYLLMTQVNAIWHIHLFFGVLASVGSGFAAIPLLSLVPRWFVKGRGLASGIVMAGVGVGTVIIPPIANLFISRYSWRTSYLVFGLASLILVIVFAQFLRRPSDNTWSAGETNTAKIYVPRSQARGRSLREAIGSPTFWIIFAMGFFYFFGAQTVMVHSPAYATDIGYSSEAAAAILSVIGFISIGSTVGGGILGDAIGNHKTMIIILGLVSLSLLGFRFSSDLRLLYVWAAVFGLGFGGFSALQSPFMAEFFGLKDLGVTISLFILAQNIGGALGSLIAGYLFDVRGNYEWSFLLAAILSIGSLILLMFLRPKSAETQKSRVK